MHCGPALDYEEGIAFGRHHYLGHFSSNGRKRRYRPFESWNANKFIQSMIIFIVLCAPTQRLLAAALSCWQMKLRVMKS